MRCVDVEVAIEVGHQRVIFLPCVPLEYPSDAQSRGRILHRYGWFPVLPARAAAVVFVGGGIDIGCIHEPDPDL